MCIYVFKYICMYLSIYVCMFVFGRLSIKSFKSLFIRLIRISFLLSVLHTTTRERQTCVLHCASQSVADKG